MLLALPLAACGDGGGMGPDPELEPSVLFGECVDDSQCPGVNSECRTAAEDGWPGGYCTIPCSDRTPCEVRNGENSFYHHCYQRPGEAESFCDRNCLSGIDCGRSAYTCVTGVLPTGGICIPVCSTDDDCGEGAFCNPYSGECQAEPPVDPATAGLEITGGPCSGDEDCASGTCIQEGTPTAPTGWVRGYCAGNCILPPGYNNNDLYFEDDLPTGDCAGEAVCFPQGSVTRGDLGICLDDCRSDGECREGYFCRLTFQLNSGPRTFTRGYCAPGQCGPGGVTCPSGYSCVSNGTTSVCAPN